MQPHRSRRVVLFLPGYSGRTLGPPLGLLSLAGALRDSGYEPRVIDGSITRDTRRTISEEIAGLVCFGHSLLTGRMVHEAIGISSMVRRLRPELPIVFGGWHPSLLSGQTLSEPFVDIVVRHQGERTLIEILKRLEA